MRFTRSFAPALLLAATAAAPLLAQAATQGGGIPTAGMPTAPSGKVDPDAYVLGVNDEVEVTIFGRENQVVKTRIKEDGTIVVPLIGAVKAAGLTPRSLSTYIADKLKSGGYFTKPVVSVDVSNFVSNSVTVFGYVGNSGLVPLDRQLSLAMLLARAGGARPGGADYAIVRRAGSTEEKKVYFDDLGVDGGTGMMMGAGDIVYIPKADEFFVYGQVGAPGAFELKRGMTLRQALARAGGPTLAGSENKVTLYRGGKKVKKVDLSSPVMPEDVLQVRERLF